MTPGVKKCSVGPSVFFCCVSNTKLFSQNFALLLLCVVCTALHCVLCSLHCVLCSLHCALCSLILCVVHHSFVSVDYFYDITHSYYIHIQMSSDNVKTIAHIDKLVALVNSGVIDKKELPSLIKSVYLGCNVVKTEEMSDAQRQKCK